MTTEQPIPIIVGVGEIKDPFLGLQDSQEPKRLILQAIYAAARDTKLPPYASDHLLSEIDSIDVVRTWTWPYDDLAGELAWEIMANPNHKVTTPRHGGDQPAKLVDEAAQRILCGRSNIAIVTGGEALASLRTYIAAKGSPPLHWTKTSTSLESIFKSEREDFQKSLGGKHGIGAPTQVYALYENAFRAHHKQTISQNHAESAQMYAEFARIAAQNACSWSYRKPSESAETVGTLSSRNRMICFPYPMLMTAFNNVNLAAACILTSTDYASEVGIPQSQWIYFRGGAGARDITEFWLRPNFYTSQSISRSLDAALEAAHLSASDIDAFEFYSCFPIVPKLACAHLSLSPTPPFPKVISLLGGLTFFGGPGNNYSMHSIVHMTNFLREGKGNNGLILANGGVITYQHVICLSKVPLAINSKGIGSLEILPSLEDSFIEQKPNGEAVVETYTVDYDRQGQPILGHVVGRLLSNGKRFLANHGNGKTLAELSSTTREPVGRNGNVRTTEGGKALFSFERDKKL